MINAPEHIEKRSFGSFCAYQTSCGCGCDKKVTMSIDEDEKKHGCLALEFKGQKCSWWPDKRWKRIWSRISVAWNHLRTGETELFETLCLNDPEHVRDIGKLLMGLADELEAYPIIKQSRILAEAGTILEALNISVGWELSPFVMQQIRELLPKIHECLSTKSIVDDIDFWTSLDELLQSIAFSPKLPEVSRDSACRLIHKVRIYSMHKPF